MDQHNTTQVITKQIRWSGVNLILHMKNRKGKTLCFKFCIIRVAAHLRLHIHTFSMKKKKKEEP